MGYKLGKFSSLVSIKEYVTKFLNDGWDHFLAEKKNLHLSHALF